MVSFERLLKSKKRAAAFLVIAALVLSIPLTLSLLSQRQDIRQRAQEPIANVITITPSPTLIPPDIPGTNTEDLFTIAAGGDCSVGNSDIALNGTEQQFLSLINQYRQQNGLGTLKTSANLSRMAAWHAKDMAENAYMSHTDSLGRSPGARAGDCGAFYGGEIVNFRTGPSNAQASITQFKNSPPHNAAMLEDGFVQVGIATAEKGGRSYWAVDFSTSDDGTTAPTTSDQPTATPTTQIQKPTSTSTPTTFPGTITPTLSPTATITPTTPTNGTFISSSLKVPGIGPNEGAGENNSPVRTYIPGFIEIINPQTNQTAGTQEIVFSLNLQDFTFKNNTVEVSPSTYKIKLRTESSLWDDVGTITFPANQTTQLDTITVVSGDINRDNVLDLQDYNILIGCYGNAQCNVKQESDLNLDGKVDEKDLNIFYSGLANRSGD